MDKRSYINLDLMISGNYGVIMIILMLIYVYMYVCMSLPNRIVSDHDFLMIIIIYKDVCMSLFDRHIRDHSCGGMIAYVVERHEGVLGLMKNQARRLALIDQ